MCCSPGLELILAGGLLSTVTGMWTVGEGFAKLAQRGPLAVGLASIGTCAYLGAAWVNHLLLLPLFLGLLALTPIRFILLFRQLRNSETQTKKFIFHFWIMALASIPAVLVFIVAAGALASNLIFMTPYTF